MRGRLTHPKLLMVTVVGPPLFALGLLILGVNSYWRSTSGGVIDQRVYAWNGLGHVVCSLGLLVTFCAVLAFASTPIRNKKIFWIVTVAALGAWCAFLGVTKSYRARYTWDEQRGITELTLVADETTAPSRYDKVLGRTFVGWQIKSELHRWLAAGYLHRTHGAITVRVTRIVPMVLLPPTLDCDCFGCCVEEDRKRGDATEPR
jgi:hypothetical protein